MNFTMCVCPLSPTLKFVNEFDESFLFSKGYVVPMKFEENTTYCTHKFYTFTIKFYEKNTCA